MAGGFYIPDDEFGNVVVFLRRDMRSITARWRPEGLHINAPMRMPQKNIKDFIDSNRTKIRDLKPLTLSYYFGQKIFCFQHIVTITTHQGKKSQIGYGDNNGDLYISLHPDTNLSSPNITRTISACLTRLMADKAESILIPFAVQVASELGVMPKEFVIGRGMRKLGHCTTKHVIQLSYNIMFFPEELVRYIICHELAHLTEMNHSADFHALCNLYCHGREKSLEKALKHFSWPIQR